MSLVFAHKDSRRTINLRMLLKVSGWLLVIEALFMCVPAAVSFGYGESDAYPLIIIAGITAFVGWLMQTIRAHSSYMGRREGFLLTASVWVWFSLFGMLPFIFSSAGFSVSDAFFESMSGFTTTGASVLDDHSKLSHGINVWRALTQWIGGMGIILFTLAVLPMLNSSGGMQMFNAEVTGITHDKLRPRISSTAKMLWGTYFVLTVALFLLLWAGPMDLYESICYTFSSISTGGFSPTAEPLSRFDSDYVYIVLTIFMFLGGVNFSLIFQSFYGRIHEVWRNDVFRMYVIVVGLFTMGFIGAVIYKHGFDAGWQDYFIYPLFQVVSTITSTGHDTGRFDSWIPFVVAMMMILMFTGACAGSTSGGSKLDRTLFLVKNLRNELARCVRPNAIYSVRVNGKIISSSIVDKVTAFMCIYVILICVGGLLLTLMGIPLVDSYFSSFSCVSNTGFSASLTGYGTSYAIIPDAGKWLLSFLMLVGRLELFTVLIIFTRPFWRK